jgi:hypothetical protein
MVRLLQAGVNQSEIYCRLASVYSQNVFSQKEVSVWYPKFKEGRTALNDNPQKHRGRLGTSHINEILSLLKV